MFRTILQIYACKDCPMGFRVQDIAVFLLCVAVVSLFIFAKVTGR